MFFGLGACPKAMDGWIKNQKRKSVGDIVMDQDFPLFSGGVKHGEIPLYIAGKGAHVEPL